MAVFAKTDLYLKFGNKPDMKCQAVLWPVLIHRVLYPELCDTPLNLFQHAILGLVRTGIVKQDILAELTGLHPALIQLIVTQCVSQGWLEPEADILTPKGEQLFTEKDDESAEPNNLKSGYVLQDVTTGHFWPRMFGQLQQIEAKDPTAFHPEFLDDRKSGRSIKPFVMKAAQKDLIPLNNELLGKAYRDYHADFQSSIQLGVSRPSASKVKLHGVQQLDDNPEAARILLWVTANDENDALWSIQDPFGLREKAWWLQESLTQQVKRDDRLLKRLEPLVRIPCPEHQTVDEWLVALNNQTDLHVLMHYPWVERQSDIKRHLAVVLIRKEKLAQGDRGESEINAALVECQKLLEVVMQWLIHSYPVDQGDLPKQKKHNLQLNKRILKAIQIPAFHENVINILAWQSLGDVVTACIQPRSSLKTLLFAAAMGVINNPQHPFKTLRDEDLKLEKLLRLASFRNQSGHAQSIYTGKKVMELTFNDAVENIQYVLEFTEKFKGWM